MYSFNDQFNHLTWAHQSALKDGQGAGFVADYPNYISPGVSGRRVWGNNTARLISLKEKFDPECRIHQGRVFASEGCVRRGWGNVFA